MDQSEFPKYYFEFIEHHFLGHHILSTKPVSEPLSKLPPVLKQNLDKNLCICMDVPKMDIIDAIANGADSVEEVKRKTSATMGSQCCVHQVERLIECIHKPSRRKGRRRRKNKEADE